MKKTICSLLCLFNLNIQAASVVDLFGDNGKRSQEIIRKYGDEISKLDPQFQKEMSKYNTPDYDENRLNKILEAKKKIIEDIKNEYAYLYVDFETVKYPNRDDYTTIEVIKSSDPDRMKFIGAFYEGAPYRQDIIDKMAEYNKLGAQLFYSNMLNEKITCPFYHCTWGFEHQKLKPFLLDFQNINNKNKQLIIDTINKDKDPQRRAAAAFLIGNFKKPDEIYTLLISHINDNNENVRNNVIRVIESILPHAQIEQLDIVPFFKLITSPYNTDRNKALLVIKQLAKYPEQQAKIIENGEKLLANLKLKQPNNHKPAYVILKKISGEDLGEYNVAAWKRWLVNKQDKKIKEKIQSPN